VTAVAAAAVFLGASLQSATGFGFALVAAPVLFAAFGPQEAVTAGVLLGVALNVLTLGTERRVPRVLRGDLVTLLAWSVPGIALGAIALRELPERALSLLVAVAVLAALAVRLWGRRARAASPVAPASAPRWSAPVAGLTSGALSTSTSLSGPPLVFHLLARGAAPAEMRDTLAALFVALALLSVPALAATGTFAVGTAIGVLLAAGLAGHLLGRRVFARLAGDRYEIVILAVLALAALVALGTSVA
jgi:uncharacterized membrane protein YfcA